MWETRNIDWAKLDDAPSVREVNKGDDSCRWRFDGVTTADYALSLFADSIRAEDFDIE